MTGRASTSPPSPGESLKKTRQKASNAAFEKYQRDPLAYFRGILGIEPWKGTNAKGQFELLEDIAESVRRQLDGDKTAPKIFRVGAGHGLGKTYGCAGIVNWFFDAFAPSITITTAPTKDQVELLLWKDIKSQRRRARERGHKLPGRVLPETPRMVRAENHWAIGRTTSDGGGQGTARAQGQHAEFMLFVCDEAEGVPKFQFDAINAMMTGGVVMIWILIANPATRASEFHKLGKAPGVQNYCFSLLDFPNVLTGEDVVPGGTGRTWVASMISKHCEVTSAHDEDAHTFQLEWDVHLEDGSVLPAGTIFRPNSEFQFRVMGVAPAENAGDALVSVARFEAAVARTPDATADPTEAFIGVDCARMGLDKGKVYSYQSFVLRHEADLTKQDDWAYAAAMKRAGLQALERGAKLLSFRVDGTGGYGSGKIDIIKADAELYEAARAAGCELRFHEVQFNHTPTDPLRYYDRATELYGELNEALRVASIPNPPELLQDDVTMRKFRFMAKNEREHRRIVKKLESKDEFKARVRPARSPDDGDGAALACAPERLFGEIGPTAQETRAALQAAAAARARRRP